MHIKNLSPLSFLMLVLVAMSFGCTPNFLAQAQLPTPTATPTKTPTSIPTETATPAPETPTPTATPLPTETPIPTETPVPTETPTEVPPTVEAPTETPLPTVEPTEAPPTHTPVPAEPTATPIPTETPQPEFQYKIINFRVLGEAENNGGIFNKGGMHHIFVTVVDANGNGIDGAVLKDANGSNYEWVSGNKGPGKTEIEMNYDPFKLFIAVDPTGPVTSEISNQMNTLYPEIGDVVGKLGSLENEYSVCPTVDVRCTPPFYNVHFSYEITFQKVQ